MKRTEWEKRLCYIVSEIHKHILDPEQIDKLLRPFIEKTIKQETKGKLEQFAHWFMSGEREYQQVTKKLKELINK